MMGILSIFFSFSSFPFPSPNSLFIKNIWELQCVNYTPFPFHGAYCELDIKDMLTFGMAGENFTVQEEEARDYPLLLTAGCTTVLVICAAGMLSLLRNLCCRHVGV